MKEGICKYCGQMVQVDTETQEGANKLASLVCNCAPSVAAAKRAKSVNMAKNIVEEIFPVEEDLRNQHRVESLQRIIDEIGDGTYHSAAIQLTGKISVSISTTGKGTIKVARTDKTKQAYETEE